MQIAVDDASIDVDVSGSGRAIVMLAGFPLTREIWDVQAAELAKSAMVIRPDLRGMGRSSAPEGPYLMETLAGDIAAVLDALAIERATIVGHSAGGYAALAFCRMHTERVQRLALVCSRLAADSPEAAREREALAERAEQEQSIDPVLDVYVPRLFAPQILESRSPVIDRTREIARQNSPRGAAAMLRGMAQRLDSYDIAADLTMPVLIVSGRHDQIVPAAETDEMCNAFPAARIQVMAQSGHVPMLEEPQALSEILGGFLGPVAISG